MPSLVMMHLQGLLQLRQAPTQSPTRTQSARTHAGTQMRARASARKALGATDTTYRYCGSTRPKWHLHQRVDLRQVVRPQRDRCIGMPRRAVAKPTALAQRQHERRNTRMRNAQYAIAQREREPRTGQVERDEQPRQIVVGFSTPRCDDLYPLSRGSAHRPGLAGWRGMKDAAAAALFNNTLIGYEEVRQLLDLRRARRGLPVQVRACLPRARPPVCACQCTLRS